MNTMDVVNRSEARLRELGIAINDQLPEIEEPSELTPRTAREVAIRAAVLSHIITIGYGASGKDVLSELVAQNLAEHLTTRERNFLAQSHYSDHDRALVAWNFAAVHGLAWSLKLVELQPLGDCPNTLASYFLPRMSAAAETASLREFSEIHAEADLYYRLHWAAREARLTGALFAKPEIEIALRRQSLDWVIGVPHDWDEIPLDT